MKKSTVEVEIQQIKPVDLYVAPWNARKSIPEASLAELVDSIIAHGIQTPLIVRPLAKGSVPHPKYEIVAGHRRMKAARRIAELVYLPCIVRQLSDAEAREIGLVDNLQREDLPPLEEAQAFADLLSSDGATVESIAAKLGKAIGYVGRRLRLLDAIAPVREALLAGAIDVGHALELARLDQSTQEQLLDWLDVGFTAKRKDDGEDDGEDDYHESGICRFCGCEEDNAYPGGCSWVDSDETVCSNPDCVAKMKAGKSAWRPTRQTLGELKTRIRQTTLIVLSAAPFPLEAEIPPMACVACPKRSSNAQLLFDDCAQDTCTDRSCFNGKVRAWIRYQLEENPKLVLVREGYDSEREYSGAVSKWDVRVIGETQSGGKKIKTCENAERAIFVTGARAGQLIEICRAASCKTHKGDFVVSQAGGSEKTKAERKKKLAKVNIEKKYRWALFTAIAGAKVAAIAVEQLGALQLETAIYAIGCGPGQYEKKAAQALGWPQDIFGYGKKNQLREHLQKLKPAEWMRTALLCGHASELAVPEWGTASKPEDLENLAKIVGVNAKKVRAALDVKPAPAAKRKKPAANRAIISSEVKKRIAAAQRKRWAKRKAAAK